MTSDYLSEEAHRFRMNRLLNSVASEVTERDGHLFWPSDSFYHKLSVDDRIEVGRRVIRTASVEAMMEHSS